VLDLCPKIRQQAHRVLVVIETDSLALVLVVVLDPRSRARPRSFVDWMSIVKAQQALAISTMQRQRIVEPMRLFWSDLNPFRLELHPEVPFNKEHLAIEQEEGYQGPNLAPSYISYYHPVIT